eukprot:COSAG01_NODE_2382_length_7770_cov_4.692318_9_plen_362_part_00
MEVEGLLPPGASPPLSLQQTAAAVGAAAAAHATQETEGSSSRTTQELTPSLTQTGDSDVDGEHSAAPATAQPGVGAASAPSAVTEASRTIGAPEKEADEGNLDDLEALQDAFAVGERASRKYESKKCGPMDEVGTTSGESTADGQRNPADGDDGLSYERPETTVEEMQALEDTLQSRDAEQLCALLPHAQDTGQDDSNTGGANTNQEGNDQPLLHKSLRFAKYVAWSPLTPINWRTTEHPEFCRWAQELIKAKKYVDAAAEIFRMLVHTRLLVVPSSSCRVHTCRYCSRCPNSASIVLILIRAKKLVPESAPKGVQIRGPSLHHALCEPRCRQIWALEKEPRIWPQYVVGQEEESDAFFSQ